MKGVIFMNKLRPSNYWNIGKIESWLSDMSTQGYHLQTLGKSFGDFEKGEPRHDSYRIEIALDKNDLTVSQHQKYDSSIWKYVTNIDKFHVFCCPYEIIVSEVNPYPEKLAESLKGIYKKTLLSLLVIIIGLVAMFKLFPYFLNETLVVKVLNGNGMDLVSSILILYSIISLLRSAYFQRRLIKSLSMGIPIDHSAPWRNTYWISISLWIIKNFIIAVILISSFALLYSSSKPLSSDNMDLPLVRLESIEKSDGSVFDKSLLYSCEYTRSWSILSPLQYSSREYLNTKGDPNPYSNTYIETKTYKLILPALEETIINSLVAEYDKSLDIKPALYEPISNDEFDILVTRNSFNTKQVFAAKNGWIIHVSYGGEQKTDAVVNAVADKLNELCD